MELGRIEIYLTPHERASRGAARRLRQWTCARKGSLFVVVGFSDHPRGCLVLVLVLFVLALVIVVGVSWPLCFP
jgi:hypothetical protein